MLALSLSHLHPDDLLPPELPLHPGLLLHHRTHRATQSSIVLGSSYNTDLVRTTSSPL